MLQTENNPAVGDLKVDFQVFDGLQVHFLVGDNGSGKTQVLELIHAMLDNRNGPEIDEGQSVTVAATDANGDIRSLTHGHTEGLDGGTYSTGTLTDANGNETNVGRQIPLQSAFLSTNVSLEVSGVRSSPDQPASVDSATNLDKQIPEYLVRLHLQDNAEIVKAFHDNGGTIQEGFNFKSRIDRFRTAYSQVMHGSKEFKEVQLGRDGYRIVFQDDTGRECDLANLSAGEKQIVLRLGYILVKTESFRSGVVLIDEPETGLHPYWQQRYVPLELPRLVRHG